MTNITIFGRNPVALVASVQAVLALLIGFDALTFIGLNTVADAVLVTSVLSALSAVYLAYKTNESGLAPFIELFKAGAAAATIYGLNLGDEKSALAITAIQAVFAAWHYEKVVPLDERGTFAQLTPREAYTGGFTSTPVARAA